MKLRLLLAAIFGTLAPFGTPAAANQASIVVPQHSAEIRALGHNATLDDEVQYFLNPALQAITSNFSGSSCVGIASPLAFQWCAQTGTPNTVNMYNGTTWVPIFTLQGTTPVFLGNLATAIVDAQISPVAGIEATKLSFTPAGTNAVATDVQTKLSQVVDLADFGVVCDGSDQHVNVQNAINAVPAGSTLRKSCSGNIGLGAADATASLYISKPLNFQCKGGGGFLPISNLGNTVNVFYFEASSISYLRSSIDGCFIGDSSGPSRYGLHAIVLDSSSFTGDIFFSLKNGSYVQQNTNSAGYGIFAINDGTRNPVGGLHNTTLCDNSIVYGGISLSGVGDSILLNNCTQLGKNRLYVSLVNAGGGPGGNFIMNGGGISNASGIVLDGMASAQLMNFEGEQSATTTSATNSFIDVAGNANAVGNVSILNAQLQTDPNKGLTSLIRVGNAVNTVIDNVRFADSSTVVASAVNITNLASNTVYGAGNQNLAAPVIDAGANSRKTASLPFADTPVGRATTDTLINKTLTSPAMTSFNASSGTHYIDGTALNVGLNTGIPTKFAGTVQYGGVGATASLLQGGAAQAKVTAGSIVAPGAGFCVSYFVAGTTAGTGKLVAVCGTSATPTTIADNIGTGF